STQTTLGFSFQFNNGPGEALLDDVSVATAPGFEGTYGTVSFSDVDTIDTHTVTVSTPTGSNYVGHFNAFILPGNDTSLGGPPNGIVTWTFNVADSDLTSIAPQTSVDQVYTVTIDDGHGGTVSKPITVTLTNPDHAPTANSDTLSAPTGTGW